MIGKLTTIIGFLRDFFSFFNHFAIPQAIKHIWTAIGGIDTIDTILVVGQMQFQPILISFIISVVSLTVIKLILNR